MFSSSSSSGASTESQAATISRAVSGVVRFRLMTRTLASFQRRAPSAIQGSQASAARTPGTLFAAIAVPVPVQQKRSPWSASPAATAPATRRATSGHWRLLEDDDLVAAAAQLVDRGVCRLAVVVCSDHEPHLRP